MNESAVLPRKTMLLVSLLQGLALLLLYRSLENDSWPTTSPLWAYPLWTVAVTLPVLLLLALESATIRRTLTLIGSFSALLVLLAIYTGWQAEPYDEFPVGNLVFVFVCSTGLACFKALMYLQQRAARIPLTYGVLFTYSWRNSLTLALSLLFVFVLWLILMLWAQLFRAIEVDLFHELFREDWLLFPVLAVSLGLAISIFRNLTQVIDSISRLLQGLIKLLLPLVISVAILFLVALPFVGLDALWSTGSGTSLLLWLLAIVLFFVNAVYQDGRGDSPYPQLVHRLIYAGLLLLPVISVISFYGLWLRLDEYGWTVARSWAFVIWLVLSLFAAGYFVGIVRRRDDWTADLARVNIGMGLVVLALMLVVNSPLLDFRKISLASQLQRVESGGIELADFDFWYARQSLARPGYLALEQMKHQVGDSDPELLEKIQNPLPEWQARHRKPAQKFWEQVNYRPELFEVPEDLRQKISRSQFDQGTDTQTLLIRTDLDRDGEPEFAMLQFSDSYLFNAQLFVLNQGGWEDSPMSIGDRFRSETIEQLTKGEITTPAPRFSHLRVGDILLQVNEAQHASNMDVNPAVGTQPVSD
ncbi:MAG: DUF4153 domain-containing protein [Gammaproteobacteria bacterium]|nr:DUF4153 domain-containing protein [Gammaproteobacteria bacterium]